MPSAIRSALDAAAWFEARAGRDRVRLPPLKLQRLLYFAQAFFAARNKGRRLMPAVFVAGDLGPVEPNLYLILENGLPDLVEPPLAPEVEDCLEDIWRRFGAKEIEELDRLVETDGLYRPAFDKAKNSEITLERMAAAYRRLGRGGKAAAPKPPAKKREAPPPVGTPPENQEVRFTADGRSVTRWAPKRRVDGPTIKLKTKTARKA